MNWKKSKFIFFTIFGLVFYYVFGIQHEALTGKELPDYTVELLQLDTNKYGYQIKQDERILITQPFVPGISGKFYFHSPEDAMRVGKLVIKRLEAGAAFSITPEDIKRLGINSFTGPY